MISVILPILRKALPPSAKGTRLDIVKPYIIIMVFSLIVGVLVIAFLGDTLKDNWATALLAGFTWDSVIQKGTMT